MLDFQAGDTEGNNILFAEDTSAQDGLRSRGLPCGLGIQRLSALETLIVSKKRAGFDAGQVERLRSLVSDVASGAAGSCKFLIFDLASGETPGGKPPPGFDDFVNDVSKLIFQAPVITVAWARGLVAGPDLELALACSMLVGESTARFSFEVDLVSSLRSYALLAHKIGFVRAERLMEGGAVLDAATVHELMLLHALVPSGSGVEAMREFIESRSRRHNAACGIYRAQRVAMLGGL